ncbi:DUF488 domain-containing protein [Rothia kristinae]|uniref:DUF488 family protein n=1 Tax=Rothia kristinae TaxID=37923 RepID=A0A199NV92_9MICC|nr:DUF488 family protein [Rothia kristinae]MBE8526853.1 DUF488 family protein [Amycolatopsis sp. H6(2020)]TDP56686.1 uncharacterized protein YeaO (DUF488 family) [Kocuria sp. AG109]KTR37659.1 hypothetical protein RSA5_07010 [Rothia kristinae]KTR58216.1 hypothetical protein SA11R_05990 [Rothia kristinae]KTR71811.1 hypothetical protein SA12R_02025 [Rothia kristinae]
MTSYRIKRIYDEPSQSDGARVLVDRIWPRGIAKDAARLRQWAKDLAPSTELREWFGHDPERFEEFSRRYREELRGTEQQAALDGLPEEETVTFVYAAKDEEHNQAVVLRDFCRHRR